MKNPNHSLNPFISKKLRDSGYLKDTETLTRLSRNFLKSDKCIEFNYYPNNKCCKKKERVMIGNNYLCCKYKYLPKYKNIIDWRGQDYRNFSFLYKFCKKIFSNYKSILDNYFIYGSGSRDLNISSYFNHFYVKEKKPIEIDNIKYHLLDSYLVNPMEINVSVKDFCRDNSNYLIWMNLISVIFDILPPKHEQMIINSNTYWNRDMWCLYITFILSGSTSNLKIRYKRLVNYDYSNFDNLYRYLYDNFQDLKKLVGRDKIIPPWSDFILENIPEDYLVQDDDIEWGSSFEEPETEEDEEEPLTKVEKKLRKKEEKKIRKKEIKKLRRLQKEEEEESRREEEERD